MRKQEIFQFIERYFAAKNHAWLTGDAEGVLLHHVNQADQPSVQEIIRHHQFFHQYGFRNKKTKTDLQIISFHWDEQNEQATLEMLERIQWIYRDKTEYEEESRIYQHLFYIQPFRGKWQVKQCHTRLETKMPKGGFDLNFDKHIMDAINDLDDEMQVSSSLNVGFRSQEQAQGNEYPLLEERRPYDGFKEARAHVYNRMQVMKYAETWWDRFNPAYRKFDVDCTNFVSQCIHAGSAPMVGMGNRARGWWYKHQGGRNDNWSYSWAVANSLRWFLGGKGSWHATIVSNPTELKIGDVICYDWDGDNHWTHNTIVVGFDGNNQPLVNAHTVESHRRYWEYRDSYAWTERTQYLFFRLPDSF